MLRRRIHRINYIMTCKHIWRMEHFMFSDNGLFHGRTGKKKKRKTKPKLAYAMCLGKAVRTEHIDWCDGSWFSSRNRMDGTFPTIFTCHDTKFILKFVCSGSTTFAWWHLNVKYLKTQNFAFVCGRNWHTAGIAPINGCTVFIGCFSS